MKLNMALLSVFLITSCSSATKFNVTNNDESNTHKTTLSKKSWIHGAENCETDKEPVFDVYQHDAQTFILRQNKCLTFEAPFIYVLVGLEKILVLDTGALNDESSVSLYDELEGVIGKDELASKQILVMHSHSHSDHYQGDVHFNQKTSVEVVETTAKGVKDFYQFTDWPKEQMTIELGGRQVTVIPSPGHQEEAISIYDPRTQWLMTGDTLYPGYIYVKHWEDYQQSIDRLAKFAEHNEVKAIMGAHIEKGAALNVYFPIGSTYQPNEASLDLEVKSLHYLNKIIQNIEEPREVIFNDFTIIPMNGIQKALSNTVRWFKQ
jgi:glyoxylase-like metal-dependent hydrolase (beta-lactamase superfamily II)